MLRLNLFFVILMTFCFSFISAQADEQRYVITNADGRIFLLDTQNGKVWKYYFNNINEQGWQQTSFHEYRDESFEYYKRHPEGELIKIKTNQLPQ